MALAAPAQIGFCNKSHLKKLPVPAFFLPSGLQKIRYKKKESAGLYIFKDQIPSLSGAPGYAGFLIHC
jgi:hypothetical protein